LLVAFVPAAIFGLLLGDRIDQLLESPMAVAISLLVGGFILLFVDKWYKNGDIDNTDDIPYFTALKIGFFQCISMIPGVSRSASTIVGGMSQKLSRKTAAEFSFFLAVPTMFGTTAKKLFDFYQDGFSISNEQVKLLLIGNIVAFIVAMLAIRYFITFLQSRGFRIFGWYRIVVGALILILLLSGFDLQVI
ncbi:MAG: undecaprenyl-diphosphate phosphatase, partial [Bacteroidetes bacterium]|nr:undecaprenyl-diphosphate phosphatase [Bacteroidota bacterium]